MRSDVLRDESESLNLGICHLPKIAGWNWNLIHPESLKVSTTEQRQPTSFGYSLTTRPIKALSPIKRC
jgi:hypothetical protein